jgi:hypothetical protein
MAARNVGEWSEIYAVARLLTNEFSHDLAGGDKRIIRAKVQHSVAETEVEYAVSDQIVSVKRGNSCDTCNHYPYGVMWFEEP